MSPRRMDACDLIDVLYYMAEKAAYPVEREYAEGADRARDAVRDAVYGTSAQLVGDHALVDDVAAAGASTKSEHRKLLPYIPETPQADGNNPYVGILDAPMM